MHMWSIVEFGRDYVYVHVLLRKKISKNGENGFAQIQKRDHNLGIENVKRNTGQK